MNWKRVLARLVGTAPTPHPRAAASREPRQAPAHRSWGVYPKNAPGDFYVEDGCCILCGVPWGEAPGHFAVDDKQCYVKRQPANDGEVQKMIAAMHVSELDCIRYKGRDRQIIDAIRTKSGDRLIDDQSR